MSNYIPAVAVLAAVFVVVAARLVVRRLADKAVQKERNSDTLNASVAGSDITTTSASAASPRLVRPATPKVAPRRQAAKRRKPGAPARKGKA